VLLQPTTPGTAQTGHSNITGTSKAGFFTGNGSLLTALNASNVATGTLGDARLSSNVATLSGAQTFNAAKSFSSAPSFTAAGVPFNVTSPTKVANLNADLLDGLDSSAFLQTVPVPLSLSNSSTFSTTLSVSALGSSSIGIQASSLNGYAILADCASGTAVWGMSNTSAGVTGSSQTSYGLVGASQTGNGIHGFSNGNGDGVRGEANGSGNGIYGYSYSGNGIKGEGYLNGVQGTTYGSSASGVYGEANNYSFGVAGRAVSAGGVGVYGECVQGGWGVYSANDLYVQGNLVVAGSKSGYVVDLVKNGGNEPLERGDLVEIAGYGEPVLGDIPVIVVRKASSRRARAVLGPISSAVELRANALQSPARADGSAATTGDSAKPRLEPHEIAGSILPGAFGNAVTLGSFAMIKVDATYVPVEAGDLLVASSYPGFAAADPDPRVGTVIGKALGALTSGTGVVPVLVNQQ
jgi:hypothetical protein